jgi:hypothetical protein
MCNWTFSLRGAHMRNRHRPSSDSTAPRSCGIYSFLKDTAASGCTKSQRYRSRNAGSIRISPKKGPYFFRSIKTVQPSHYLRSSHQYCSYCEQPLPSDFVPLFQRPHAAFWFFIAATSSFEPKPQRESDLIACVKGTSTGCTRSGVSM